MADYAAQPLPEDDDEEGMAPHGLIPEDYKVWYKEDLKHAQDWRDEARVCYDFVAGEQWSDSDKAKLENQERPLVTFNRVGVIVDAVCGAEIGNRKEVRYIPREQGDVKANEGLTSTAQWFRDQAGADDEDSEAFSDSVTAGMGWTETRLDYDANPDGEPVVERIDPFEMVWDYASRQKNLIDARRIWRVKDFPIAEARGMFPGFEDDELHADWAQADKNTDTPHVADKITTLSAGKRDTSGVLKAATIVHCQYIERVKVWRVMMPSPAPDMMQMGQQMPQEGPSMGGQMVGQMPPMAPPPPPEPKEATLSEEEYQTLIQTMPEIAESAVQQWKRVRKQAFLGSVVLAAGDTPCPDEFNFQCITGKRDRNKGQWFGLVRSMLDPQRWANKFFSQLMHLINSSAKGGIVAERTAFENPQQAEESWAKADRITWMNNGAISGDHPKWAPKPSAVFPVGIQYLMENAVQSIRDVSGVSLELLGQRETNQPGVLEYQRRQAGMTILQPLFDSLKLYRQNQGRLMLYYIQNDLSDGRLVQIVGENGKEYVPLIKGADREYDIIVDDSPNAPNNKERNWQIIQATLPVVQEMLTPPIMLKLLEQSPLDSTIIADLKELAEKPNPEAEMMKQLQMRMAQVEMMLKEGQAEKAKADAMVATAEAQQIAQQPPGGELALKRQEMQGELGLKSAEMRAEQGMKRETMQFDGGLKQQQTGQEMQMDERKAVFGMALDAAKNAAAIRLAEKKAVADAQIKREAAKRQGASKPNGSR